MENGVRIPDANMSIEEVAIDFTGLLGSFLGKLSRIESAAKKNLRSCIEYAKDIYLIALHPSAPAIGLSK